ncbi:MAG: hypothetical protein A2787_07860 [Omnitrophica WOR_2 bacterium RIFCSPHIGHO2_01_FULL_48_9]|nr:MAG: hypothetical protein A3D10_03815 [Omnitrophica WOR_2 bacterium RIFCSPHIGHO2_02_FULL_48_11]OGX33761.1 MAG: hypothetical protein A2787_07860 [Omnitrophica WOR_2 bacterium RIFCSPHIGHO2_01_FULL_48_9]
MYIVIFITAKDKAEAEKIARHLVSHKLAACVNISSGVESFFWWENKIDTASEVLLIVKSKKSLFKKIVAAVRAVHSYNVPEIIALPVIDGHKDYLKWINDSLRKK